MSKKSKRKRNPVYLKGYEEGFNRGKQEFVGAIAKQLERLFDEPGIGPVTQEKIRDAVENMKMTVRYSDEVNS